MFEPGNRRTAVIRDVAKSHDFQAYQYIYIWVVVNIMAPFWVSLLSYGTYYLGYPKRGPNFDNHPFVEDGRGIEACIGFPYQMSPGEQASACAKLEDIRRGLR